MKYVLAIDQGTSGSRAVVYDQQSKVIAASYEEFPQYFPNPGWVEHNPEEIWQSVNNSIQKVLKKIPKDSICAIGITNQRETTIVWNRDTGKPVYNAIVWQCRRTAERCQKLAQNRKKADLIKRKTGLPIDAYFSASKIEWILKNVPRAKELGRKGKLCFGTTDSWVLWKLTQAKVHATDYTNASRTMLFNIGKKVWDKQLLREFNIPVLMLPQVKKSSGVFGLTAKNGRLNAGIPISGIAGDQQAALFGQTCFYPGEIKNTYGTGSFILLNTGKKRIISKFGLITTLGCGSKGEPVYVLEGAVFIAGAVIQWLRDGLKLIKNAKQTEKIAQSVKSNDGVYFVPALVGLGAPFWQPQARGNISGITRGTKEAHIVRAALESMAYQTKDVLEAMTKDSGLEIKNIKVDGGAIANNFLAKFQADMLGIPVIRPKIIESTSLGAAYLAGLAIGFWKNTKGISSYWQKDKIFKPKMHKKKSDKLYAGWKIAVKRTLI